MKKLALITALVTTSAIAMPAMADNGHGRFHQDASNHKYVKYNNGNAYGKYKNKHKVKANKYAKAHYPVKRVTTYPAKAVVVVPQPHVMIVPR